MRRMTTPGAWHSYRRRGGWLNSCRGASSTLMQEIAQGYVNPPQLPCLRLTNAFFAVLEHSTCEFTTSL